MDSTNALLAQILAAASPTELTLSENQWSPYVEVAGTSPDMTSELPESISPRFGFMAFVDLFGNRMSTLR